MTRTRKLERLRHGIHGEFNRRLDSSQIGCTWWNGTLHYREEFPQNVRSG